MHSHDVETRTDGAKEGGKGSARRSPKKLITKPAEPVLFSFAKYSDTLRLFESRTGCSIKAVYMHGVHEAPEHYRAARQMEVF